MFHVRKYVCTCSLDPPPSIRSHNAEHLILQVWELMVGRGQILAFISAVRSDKDNLPVDSISPGFGSMYASLTIIVKVSEARGLYSWKFLVDKASDNFYFLLMSNKYRWSLGYSKARYLQNLCGEFKTSLCNLAAYLAVFELWSIIFYHRKIVHNFACVLCFAIAWYLRYVG